MTSSFFNQKHSNNMTTIQKAIKFYAEYFNISEEIAWQDHHIAVSCMAKFADSLTKKKELVIPDVVKSVCDHPGLLPGGKTAERCWKCGEMVLKK